jgi:hypothetical protein
MTVARTVRPTDLVALVSFDGRVYPNEAKTRDRLGREESSPSPLESALEQWFSFATGRQTWISVRGSTLRGLISARRRSSNAAWEVDCLINAAEEESVCMSLLDRVSEEAGRGGAEKIFLRLAAASDVVPIVRRTGFVPCVVENRFAHEGPVSAERPDRPARLRRAGPALSLRRRSRADAYALFQLYNVAVPESVRRVEAATFAEWLAAQERHWLGRRSTQLVLERDGYLGAWIRTAAEGDIGRFDLLVHPRELDLLEPLLMAALARLSGQGLLLTLVPEYQEPLARLLERMGFERQDQYVVMAKRTAALVKAPRLAANLQTPVVF